MAAAQLMSSAAHVPAGVSLAESELLADGSLSARFVRRWSQRIWPVLQDVDGSWIVSDELEERTRRAARSLLRSGLEPGDRLVISAETSADLVIAHVASLRAGLVAVPVNTAYTREEVTRIVRAARPRASAVDDDARARWIAEASSQPVLSLGIGLGEAADGEEPIDRAIAADPALLVYTSGTTGQPKGALLSHGNLLSSATAVGCAWRWEPGERLLLALPLFHVHGLGVGVIGSLCAGGAIVLRPRFDARDLASRTSEADLFFGVPAMYQRLAASGRAEALAPLRLLVCGSAPLPAALAEEVARAGGQIPLERYGMTETMMLTSNPYDGPRRPGTVGFPLPGVELRLAEEGEVEVRGPNVIAAYYERPDADAESFTDDGWFRTGDLGAIGEDGYLTLVGRSKELIITGGFNVHPREVEEVLGEHPDVREVAVVGRPSEAWGEEVTAVIVAEGRIDPDQLRALAASRLAPYKVPKRFEFAPELPRNALGKIVRNQL
jgi:malonyl-CoA/methylmalonyl-CoA synthetase